MNLEKSKPKLISVSGTCKYCHQMRVTKVREGTPQSQIDEIVSGECGCPGAIEAIMIKSSYERARDYIHRTCQQSRNEHPTDARWLAKWNEREIAMIMAVRMMLDGVIKSASFKLDSMNDVKISQTSNSKIQIKFIYKDEDESKF